MAGIETAHVVDHGDKPGFPLDAHELLESFLGQTRII